MSDARMATWAAALLKKPCSVLDVHALFQLLPTSKHPWMGLPFLLLSHWEPLCHIRALAWHWQLSQFQPCQ